MWWSILTNAILMCKSLAKCFCHASLLKVIDVRLKEKVRLPAHCVTYLVDDVKQLVLQCPALHKRKRDVTCLTN